MVPERRQRLEAPAARRDRHGGLVLRQAVDGVVADDVSFVGSFNFSRSGERNAEDVVEIHDPTTAAALARYTDDVRGRYPPATPPTTRAGVDPITQNPGP